jgi:hypothetical protein
MQAKSLIEQFKEAILNPEPLWQKQVASAQSWQSLLKSLALPVIAAVALVSALLTKLFGYHIPLVGVVRPTLGDMVLQVIGGAILYLLSLLVLGWVAAWLAGMMEGKNDINRGVAMLFWISIPSLAGQVLSPIPMVGWVIGMGLGIYSLVLLYKAIPVFMEVPANNRVKHFILFIIASVAFSILFSVTAGKLFQPKGMQDQITQKMSADIVVPQTDGKDVKKDPAKVIESYLDSMVGGDYGQKTIEASAKDRFKAPADNRLTRKQVDTFIALAKKIQIVQKEQSEALKQKYDKLEKKEEPSFGAIFSSIKDLSGVATLEMKVVKGSGENWAEYQWIKDRVREAYYTPSLNEATEHNAKLIKEYRDLIAGII